MTQMIFVNLPVEDLDASVAFYNALGFPTNGAFANEQASNAVISDNIMVMLLTKPFFSGFISRPIADTKATVAALYAISRESRDEVDALLTRALNAGAVEPRPAEDLGFMYQRAFSDPDGHIWEVAYMDMGAMTAPE